MANINSTTTSKAVGSSSGETFIPLTSLANISVNDMIFVDRELMNVDALLPNVTPPGVRVRRGIAGTCVSHAPQALVYTGPPSAFATADPVGVPPAGQQPFWINVKTGVVWVAQGDEGGANTNARYWVPQATTYGRGALGIRTVTSLPTQAVQ